MAWTAHSWRSGHHVGHIPSIAAPRALRCSKTALSLGKAPAPLCLGMAEWTSLSHSGPLLLLCLAVLLHDDKRVSSTTCNSSLPTPERKKLPHPTALAMHTLYKSKAHRHPSPKCHLLPARFTGQSLLRLLMKPFTFRILRSATKRTDALCFVQLCCLGCFLHTENGGSATTGCNCSIHLRTSQFSTPC